MNRSYALRRGLRVVWHSRPENQPCDLPPNRLPCHSRAELNYESASADFLSWYQLFGMFSCVPPKFPAQGHSSRHSLRRFQAIHGIRAPPESMVRMRTAQGSALCRDALCKMQRNKDLSERLRRRHVRMTSSYGSHQPQACRLCRHLPCFAASASYWTRRADTAAWHVNTS